MSLNLGEKCFIIAEAGTCYLGNSDVAFEYAVEAYRSGADAIKFQIFDNPTQHSCFCWIEGDEERSKRWKQSRIGLDQWKEIKKYCDDLGIVFLASVFEYETVKWLSELDVVATKVASRAANNLEAFKNAPKPLLVSNGMYEVDTEYVMECEANYPSTRWWSGAYLGFSDHSGTPWRAIDAMARGCKLIETHFYIDKEDAGPDLPASLDLDNLSLVCEAREVFNEKMQKMSCS